MAGRDRKPTAREVKYARAGMEATSRDSRRWLARNVNQMLENPVYAGRVIMNKWTQKRYLGIPHEKNDERGMARRGKRPRAAGAARALRRAKARP